MTDHPPLHVVEVPKPAHLDTIIESLKEHLAAAERGEYEGGLVIFELSAASALRWSVLGTQHIAATLGQLRLLEDALIGSQREPR